MQIVHQIFGESLLQALGWTFIHSLWQIGVVAVLLAMARLLMQRSAPRYRYLAGNLALGVICAAAVVTFWLLLDPQIQSAPLENGDSAVFFPAGATDGLPAGAKVDSGSTSNVYFDRFVSYYNQHLPLIVTLWLLGALIFVLRLLGGLALLKSLRHRAVREAGADAQVRLSRIAKQLGVQKPVKLLERLSLPQVFSPVDTFPRGKTRVTVEHKGQRVRFQIEGGAITSLKIDGKTIPESEFEDYRPLVEEILNELPPVPPTPPAPPAPPALEEVPAPPAPPQPPRFGFGYIHSDSLGANGSRVYQYGLRDFNYDSLRIRGSDVFKLDDSGNVWLFENDSVYRAFPPRSDEWQVFPNIRLRTDGDFQFFPDTFPPGQSYPDSLMRRNEITVRGWWEKGRRNVDSILASAQEKRERIMRELERKLQLQEKEMDRMKEEQEQQIEKFFRQQELRRERKIDLTSRIEKEMMRDGLIESVDKYRLELSADAMKVDGEEQPASIAQKYRDMYERNTGISFQGDTNIVISKSNQD